MVAIVVSLCQWYSTKSTSVGPSFVQVKQIRGSNVAGAVADQLSSRLPEEIVTLNVTHALRVDDEVPTMQAGQRFGPQNGSDLALLRTKASARCHPRDRFRRVEPREVPQEYARGVAGCDAGGG